MATKPIFPPKISSIFSNQRGLTLIEIMVVLAILAAIVTIGVPRMLSSGQQIRNTMRTLSVISRRLHHMARMNRKTYRLAIQLGEGQTHAFWIESSEKGRLLSNEDQALEDEERLSRLDEDEKPPPDFVLDTSILKKPQELPSKVFFEDVELSTRNSVINSGRAYIHYLPQGFVEEAAIHITDGKEARWTLLIHPLTGQAELTGRYVSVKELNK